MRVEIVKGEGAVLGLNGDFVYHEGGDAALPNYFGVSYSIYD